MGNKIQKGIYSTLLFGLFLMINALPSIAQTSPKELTILYSNNIWAEIDPCPV
jgi:hypothetical protein